MLSQASCCHCLQVGYLGEIFCAGCGILGERISYILCATTAASQSGKNTLQFNAQYLNVAVCHRLSRCHRWSQHTEYLNFFWTGCKSDFTAVFWNFTRGGGKHNWNNNSDAGNDWEWNNKGEVCLWWRRIICEVTWSTWCKCCLIHETLIFMVNFVISWLICAVSISVSCWYVGLYQLQYMFKVNSEWWARSKCCSKWSNLNPDIRTCLPPKSALKLLMR